MATHKFTVNDLLILVNPDSLVNVDEKPDNDITDIVIPYALNRDICSVVEDISNFNRVALSDDKNTHFDAYIVIRICVEINMRQSYIQYGFEAWPFKEKWATLTHTEYLYPTYKLCKQAVNWHKFFREYSNPYISFVAALQLKEIINDPYMYLDIVEFFDTFDVTTIFNKSNDETRSVILRLNRQKRDIGEYFLINPHDPTFKQYMIYKDVDIPKDTVWRCDKISRSVKPIDGERVITDMGEFQRRFDSFTCGLFKKSPNPNIPEGTEFPWKYVAVAGGSIRQVIEYKYKPRVSSDVDIFICGPSYKTNAAAYKLVREWFKSPGTYYGVRNSIVYVYILDVNRTFQIICANDKSPFDVIRRFDTSQIQWVYFNQSQRNDVFKEYEINEPALASIKPRYDGMTVLGTHNAMRTIKTRIATCVNTERINSMRLVKTMISGYHISKDIDCSEKKIDLGHIIDNPNSKALKEIIRDMHTFFIPSSDLISKMDEEDQDNYIQGMIKLHSKATIVSKDVDVIDKNIIINGNFDTDYEINGFENFIVDSVYFTGAPRHFSTPIKDRTKKVIKIFSSYLTVVRATSDEYEVILDLKVTDDKFIQFIKDTLEIRTMRIFTPRKVTKNILSKDNIFGIKFTAVQIAYQVSCGYNPIKDSSGEPLNIYEDLSNGDEVKVLFSVLVTVGNEFQQLNLRAHKLIKKRVESDTKSDNKPHQIVEMNKQEIINDTNDVVADTTVVTFEDVNVDIGKNQ